MKVSDMSSVDWAFKPRCALCKKAVDEVTLFQSTVWEQDRLGAHAIIKFMCHGVEDQYRLYPDAEMPIPFQRIVDMKKQALLV